MVLETERLLIRDYTLADFEALFEILSDAKTLQHYADKQKHKTYVVCKQ